MCGICGIFRFDNQPVLTGQIDKACGALRHRGPDFLNSWIESSSNHAAGLGSTRLAVLDPRPHAHQPMHDDSDRYHLVFNGEIYNYREIRRSLIESGDTFHTQGDTEVVLKACARWGVDALSRFNGMWGIAFYDSMQRSGFIARDRFGIKPLFYRANEDGLWFASEMNALDQLGDFDRQINPQSVMQLLRHGYIAHSASIDQNVRRLAPGYALSFSDSFAQAPQAYYSIPTKSVRQIADYGEARTNLRRKLGESIVRRRVSDVPIGAFLSGGLDSSIIVYHLASATSTPLQTFSVGYAGQQSYDETSYARIVAKRFGTDHHEIVLTQDNIIEMIPRVLDHLSEPVGDSSIIPTSLVSEFAADHVTVALSGDGGDELFGGYWRYLGHETLNTYQRIPSALRRMAIEPLLACASVSRSSGLANRVRQFRKLLRAKNGNPISRHLTWSRILSPEAEKLFVDRDELYEYDTRLLALAESISDQGHEENPLNRIFSFDLQYSLPADMLQKVDLASMMHSLEVRVPFLDHEVVEAAMAMPAHFKIDRGLRKRILVDAYRGLLPDVVLDRSKQGFEVPIGEYFRGPLREIFLDTVTREAVESLEILSFEAMMGIYEDHLARRADHADLLFSMLSLCWWLR